MLGARIASDAGIVTLDKQDRRPLGPVADHACSCRARSSRQLGGTRSYAIQAKIAACHARAARVDDTDWTQIAALYGDLVELTRSPIVELNRAVAVSIAEGPEAGPGSDRSASRRSCRA